MIDAIEPATEPIELNFSKDSSLTWAAVVLAQARERRFEADEVTLICKFAQQQVRQQVFWESQSDASDDEVDRVARETEITVEQLCRALLDVLIADRFERRTFIDKLADSDGDLDEIVDAYQIRSGWSAQEGPVTFTAEDAEPYRIELARMFDHVFRQATEEGDNRELAIDILKRLLVDFGTVEGVNFRGWLGRRMADAMPTDLEQMQVREMIKQYPEKFDEYVDRFLRGEDVAGLR